METSPPVGGLDRPFMLMTAAYPRRPGSDVAQLWSQLGGWRLDVRAEGPSPAFTEVHHVP